MRMSLDVCRQTDEALIEVYCLAEGLWQDLYEMILWKGRASHLYLLPGPLPQASVIPYNSMVCASCACCSMERARQSVDFGKMMFGPANGVRLIRIAESDPYAGSDKKRE